MFTRKYLILGVYIRTIKYVEVHERILVIINHSSIGYSSTFHEIKQQPQSREEM